MQVDNNTFAAVNYPYLVVSGKYGEPADILTIRDFNKVKKQRKRRLRKEQGLR